MIDVRLCLCFFVMAMVLLATGCISQYQEPAISENGGIETFDNETMMNTTSVLQQPTQIILQDKVLRTTPREIPAGFLF